MLHFDKWRKAVEKKATTECDKIVTQMGSEIPPGVKDVLVSFSQRDKPGREANFLSSWLFLCLWIIVLAFGLYLFFFA